MREWGGGGCGLNIPFPLHLLLGPVPSLAFGGGEGGGMGEWSEWPFGNLTEEIQSSNTKTP